MNTLLLIDGNAIMHRAYHALPPFKTDDGTLTQVTYGFLAMLHKTIVDFHPSYVVVCFDTPEPTFRQKLFKEYQAQRPKADREFISQIDLVRKMLDTQGIPFLAMPGYEADDIIGTLTHLYKNLYQILILTGDKDLFQLIDKQVNIISPKTGVSTVVMYDENEAKKKLGIAPRLVPDFKGLMGDPSDNYKGAKGIGPKTAAKLLDQFTSVESMLNHTDQINDERIREIITSHKDEIILSKKLATIDTNVPVELDIEKAIFEGFSPKLKEFLEKYQMKSLVKRIFYDKKQDVKKASAKKNKLLDHQKGLF